MNRNSEGEWNTTGLPAGPAPPSVNALPPGQDPWATPPAKGISYGQLASQHKLVLLAFLLLGAVAGTAYVTLQTPLYDAAATVELVGLNQSFLGMNQVDPQAGTDSTTASVSNIQTQTRILTSRNLLNRVIDDMDREMMPVTTTPDTVFGKLHTRLFNYLRWGQNEPLAQSREAIRAAAKSVSAHGIGTSRLIEISCQSTSPQVAADFVNALARAHILQAQNARTNDTKKTSQWVDSQLEESKSRLQEAGEKLREFVQKSGMDFFPEQTTLADSKLRQLQVDVAGIQADRIAKQSRWELAKNAPAEDLPDVLNDATLQGLKSRLAELRTQLAPLTVTLTAENIRVKRIQSQINQTEQTLQKEEVATKKRLEADYEEALRREKLLLGAYGAQTHSVSGQADKAAQYAMLRRDVEIEQQLYNTLLQQSSQADLIRLAPPTSIRVVDEAIADDVPSSPTPMRQIPMAALVGGVLGFSLLVLRENSRRKKVTFLFDAPGHTQTLLGVPELGVIPSAQLESPKKALGVRSPAGILNGSPVATLGIARQNGRAGTPDILAWRGSKSSLLAESFRQTLVSILRTQPREHNAVYVITSAGPGEGKTTMSANLAVAMAETGQRVLLIDADLRRSHVHALFGAKEQKGLVDLLNDPEPLDASALAAYLQPTGVERLQVMTSGLAQLETPALLFFSPRVKELVGLLQQQFDTILIDTAPALQFPDARLWGKYSDGVVLVLRAGFTRREGASSACQLFLDDGIPVLGTILNDWTPREGGQQGYYPYGYASTGKK
jgi:capsular exopolysaccharide synthesis family protein